MNMLTAQGAPYTATTMADVLSKMQQGYTPLRSDGTPYGIASMGGGYLFDGCPLNVVMGVSPLTLAQATVLVENAPFLQSHSWNGCLQQAQAIVAQNASPATTQPAPASVVSPSTSVQITVATAPSIPGALPNGSTVGATFTGLTSTYRFILQVPAGFATGANRQGCSQTNTANCDAQMFSTLAGAIAYALQNGEIPYQVTSAAEPWAIISGSEPVNPNQIYNADGSLGPQGIGASLSSLPWWAWVAAAYLVAKVL